MGIGSFRGQIYLKRYNRLPYHDISLVFQSRHPNHYSSGHFSICDYKEVKTRKCPVRSAKTLALNFKHHINLTYFLIKQGIQIQWLLKNKKKRTLSWKYLFHACENLFWRSRNSNLLTLTEVMRMRGIAKQPSKPIATSRAFRASSDFSKLWFATMAFYWKKKFYMIKIFKIFAQKKG